MEISAFRVLMLKMANCDNIMAKFDESSQRYLNAMSIDLWKISFNCVQTCSFDRKINNGLTFRGHSVFV